MIFLRKNKKEEILKKINKSSRVKRLIQFMCGSLLVSISFNLFLSPNKLVPGGVSGIAIILNSLFGFKNTYVILVASVILLIASYFLLGKEKTKASVLGTLMFPLFVELTKNIGTYIAIDNTQILLSSIFGGLLFGFGAGMIFKAGYTSGGTDILNQIISKYFKISMGNSMIVSDGMIVLLSGFVFGINKLMYSIVILYIISYMADKVLLGISDSKAFYIITSKEKEVKEFIIKYLNHGVTVFKARGGYNKKEQTVLMCVLPTKDYYKLKEGIHSIDSDSFFVVTDAYEVFGGE